jgi:hypothetical protein
VYLNCITVINISIELKLHGIADDGNLFGSYRRMS